MIRISKMTSNVNCTTHRLPDFGEVPKFILNDWAPGVFKDGYRNINNFSGTDLYAIDIDGGLTIDGALTKLDSLGINYLIGTSRNHQKVKHPGEPSEQPACDRIRVVVPLDKTVTDQAAFRDLGQHFLYLGFPLDKKCLEPARFFYGCKQIVKVETGKKPLDTSAVLGEVAKHRQHETSQRANPTQLKTSLVKGRLSRATSAFIEKGTAPGEWNSQLFKAAVDFNEQGYSIDEAISELEKPCMLQGNSGHLDRNDMATIYSAYKREPKYEPRVDENQGFPCTIWSKDGNVPDKNKPANIRHLIQNILKWTIRKNKRNERIYKDDKQFDDYDMSILVNKGRELGLSGSDSIYRDVVNELAVENEFDPLKDLLDQNPWDGKDHLSVAVSAIALKDGCNKEFCETMFKKWYVAMYAKAATFGITENHGVLIFLGEQGGEKSKFCRSLWPEPLRDLSFEKQINPENKDDEIHLFEKIFWNVAELDATTNKKEASAIKEFITKKRISVRPPYGRFSISKNACASFIASVNREDFLNDLTGNRRMWVIPVEKMNPRHGVCPTQMLAQAKAMFEMNPCWFILTKDEESMLNDLNMKYQRRDIVSHLFDKIEPGKGDTELTSTEILIKLRPNKEPTSGEISNFGRMLTNAGFKKRYCNRRKTHLYDVMLPVMMEEEECFFQKNKKW